MTIVDTIRLINPIKNKTTMSPTHIPIMVNPTLKLIGVITSPITDRQNRMIHKLARNHFNFQ